jgi:DNA-binding beta-propeller fold protein YncE
MLRNGKTGDLSTPSAHACSALQPFKHRFGCVDRTACYACFRRPARPLTLSYLCGSIAAEAIFEAIPSFSRDVADIVAQYAREWRLLRLLHLENLSAMGLQCGVMRFITVSDDFIYVVNDEKVLMFQLDGTFVRAVGGVARPRGVALDAQGNLLVVEGGCTGVNSRINLFRADGCGPPRLFSDPLFTDCKGICVCKRSGNVYICDSDRAYSYSNQGGYVNNFVGSGEGHLNRRPWGIAVKSTASEGSDAPLPLTPPRLRLHRLQSLNLIGQIELNVEGSKGSAQCSPVDVYDEDRVFISNTREHCVDVFGTDGVRISSWGSRGSLPDQFESPMGMAFDSRTQTLLVCDYGNKRVQVRSAGGVLLQSITLFDSGEPLDVCVAANGLAYVCGSSNSGRDDRFIVSIFAS